MSEITTSLKGLIRRVEKHMEAIFVAAAFFFMTLGFYVIFEQPQHKIWGGYWRCHRTNLLGGCTSACL
jgi:hypothetical protein